MARYIDADFAEEKLKHYLYDSAFNQTNEEHSKVFVDIAERRIHTWLNLVPTADVRENVKGEWFNNMNGTYECSICGIKHSRSNYCPHCGANMQSRLQGTEIDETYIDISGDGTVIEQIRGAK